MGLPFLPPPPGDYTSMPDIEKKKNEEPLGEKRREAGEDWRVGKKLGVEYLGGALNDERG